MISNFVCCLVFDLDDTLVDRGAAFIRVTGSFYEAYLRGSGLVTREEAVGRMVGWDEDGYAERKGMFVRWIREWPWVGLDVGGLMRWYQTEMERQVRPDGEVNGFLAWLNEERVPWGIVTNGRSGLQRATCRAAGLEGLAPFIIVSEEAGYGKPDPRIYGDALRAMGIAAPEQVMFVGDNPRTDIDGAKGFGMRAAWVRRGREYPSGLRRPDHVIDRVVEVRGLVGGGESPS